MLGKYCIKFATAILSVAAVTVAILTTGCSKARAPRIAEDTAVLLVEMPFRNLDPRFATDAVSQRINNLTHVALLRHDEKMRLVGELADSWAVDGHTRFTFRLKAGAVFHDGAPITAEDVLESFREYKRNSPHAYALAHVIRMRKLSERELRLETDRPQPFLIDDLPVFKVFRQGSRGLIAAGRFKPVAVGLHEVVLEPFERYFEGASPDGLKKIVFRYVSDETTRYQSFARGDSNVILNSLSLSKLLHLMRKLPPTHQQILSPGINYSYLSFNFRNPALKDARVRRAIAHAIDRDSIRQNRMGGLAENATGIISPAVSYYYEPNVMRYEFDPEKAQRLLDEAGYARRGRWRFSLTFKCTAEKFSYDLVTIIAGQLRAIGIDARIQTVEAGTFFSDIKAGRFDLFLMRWIGVMNPSIYFKAFHSSQIGKTNRGAYSSPRMDALIDRGLQESDNAKRRALFSDIQKLAAQDLPYVSLWYWNNLFIGTNKMRNVVMYPNGNYLTFARIRVPRGGSQEGSR